jgi:probable rRNA maturation factor
VNVFLADEQDVPVDSGPLRRLALEVLEGEGMPADTEVAVIFIDAEHSARYNERFLQRTGATDVISLPIEDLDPDDEPPEEGEGPPLALGDVLICPAVVREQAAAAGERFEDRIRLLVVHGLLHLLGYDHEDDEEAAVMEARERDFLGRRGRRA